MLTCGIINLNFRRRWRIRLRSDHFPGCILHIPHSPIPPSAAKAVTAETPRRMCRYMCGVCMEPGASHVFQMIVFARDMPKAARFIPHPPDCWKRKHRQRPAVAPLNPAVGSDGSRCNGALMPPGGNSATIPRRNRRSDTTAPGKAHRPSNERVIWKAS